MTIRPIDTPTKDIDRRRNAEFISSPEELDTVRSQIHTFIRQQLRDSRTRGVVVAMSGGIDSTLTAMLAVEAIGSDRVTGLGLPSSKFDSCEQFDARIFADGLGIDFHEMHLRPIVDAFSDTVFDEFTAPASPRAMGNMVARQRMICAYYVANTRSRLVCGTANRSELLLGYFTKYGDGGADIHPLGGLYKSEVRALAQHVGVPRRIVEKSPSAGVTVGQTDAEDLGATYDVIDPLLHRLVEREMSVTEAIKGLDLSPATAREIAAMTTETAHKRQMPPFPAVDEFRTDVNQKLTVDAERLDEIYSILATRHCRTVVRFFEERQRQLASVDEIAEYFTEAPAIRLQLHHSILPRMAEASVLDYDDRSHAIRYHGHPVIGTHFETITSN